ncbi:MotA/TolQ/ExbB proton channel family protein [Acaryochloris sp. IP29b_bin.137]|uniref:MotA/TolQ/ExbB proton channel family protein n=1 Tax=Acaryochloris sp. IP29b_bin.137 TaxID=2969217 RepID=UPI00262EB71B|nr:MotA/TolQ/ExbB proton channel family protein [Acaryochloris sp. IP29b_bin.137]
MAQVLRVVIRLFQAGGIVMIPLLIFSIVVFALTIERIRFWFTVTRDQRSVTREFLQLYRTDPELAFDELKQHTHLPLPRIFLEALELENASLGQFRLALEGATQAEIPILKRFNTIFQTVVAVAPLLGLLGTILGLIRSFSSIKIGQIGANATNVTGGISEALVSTAAGMVVAIATLVVTNIFRGLYRRQIAMFREYASQLEILYEWHVYAKNGGSQPMEESYASMGR